MDLSIVTNKETPAFFCLQNYLAHINTVTSRLRSIFETESLNKSREDNVEILLSKPDIKIEMLASFLRRLPRTSCPHTSSCRDRRE